MSNPNVGTPVGGFPDGPGAGELTDADLIEAAKTPAQVIQDGLQVTERPLADLIALQDHLNSKQVTSPFTGIRFGVFCPPGARGSS